jgi:hypothetical protein
MAAGPSDGWPCVKCHGFQPLPSTFTPATLGFGIGKGASRRFEQQCKMTIGPGRAEAAWTQSPCHAHLGVKEIASGHSRTCARAGQKFETMP